MFEPSKSYVFYIKDRDGFSSAAYKVVGIDGQLLTLRSHSAAEFIFNTGYSGFLKAEPLDRDADELPIIVLDIAQ